MKMKVGDEGKRGEGGLSEDEGEVGHGDQVIRMIN